uniref:hypothetical protein n=1 Tax=Peterkaempfera griseoplana TaxID=66896 RepID=UPI0006E3CEEE
MNAVLFAFSAHPEALEDLRRVPAWVRDSALLHLQQLVRVEQRGPALGQHGDRDLRGCRKLYLDAEVRWRAVYQERRTPPGSLWPREIHLLAVGPRADGEVYDTAARRLHATPAPAPTPRGRAALA